MNSKFGGSGWGRTNDQPIMRPDFGRVMETLGHSQISLTMNTYSHVLPALQREAADRMEAALSGS
jgi:integrase